MLPEQFARIVAWRDWVLAAEARKAYYYYYYYFVIVFGAEFRDSWFTSAETTPINNRFICQKSVTFKTGHMWFAALNYACVQIYFDCVCT